MKKLTIPTKDKDNKKEVIALTEKDIKEMNLEDLEKQLETEMSKTDKELKRLKVKE